MKTQILDSIASIVGDICDVSIEDLRSCSRRTELIEARSILVWHANKCGMSAHDIAKYINKKNCGSIYCYLVKYRYFKKSSISFRLFSSQVERQLSHNFELTV